MSKATQLNNQIKMEKIAALLAPPRLDEAEKSTLKAVFGDAPETYTILRDLFFGFEITPEESKIVELFKPIKGLLRKIFIPTVNKSVALGQNFDLWQTQDIKTAVSETFDTVYTAKLVLLDMLEAGFKRIDNPADNEVSLEIHKSLPHLVARNSYINYIDSQIRFIIQFVNMDSLTAEERLKMMSMNSAK